MAFMVGRKSKNGTLDQFYAVSGDGAVLAVRENDSQQEGGVVAHTLVRSRSQDAWISDKGGQSWKPRAPIRQIEAYDAGFVILTEDSQSPVYTMGDARFEDCLGRDVGEERYEHPHVTRPGPFLTTGQPSRPTGFRKSAHLPRRAHQENCCWRLQSCRPH